MKRPTLVNSIELLLFFVLLAGALLVLGPVSKRLDSVLSRVRDSVLQRLETDTGLRFSYSALSPSIFRSLNFTDLVITDASNDSVLARISNVSISFDFLTLIRGDIGGAFKEVVIQNGSVSIDAIRNSTVIALFNSLSPGEGSVQSQSKEPGAGFISDKPLTLRIRNIDVVFSDAEQEVFFHIGKGLAGVESGEITFELDSKIRYSGKKIAQFGALSAGMLFRGSINSSLDSGSASLTVQNLEGNQFSVSRLSLITSFSKGILSVSTVQELQPVDIRAVWDIAQKNLSASFICEKLLPFRLVRGKDEKSVLGQLRDTVVTGSAYLNYTGKTGFDYSLKLDGDIPSSFYQGGTLAVDFGGTSKKMDFTRFRLLGTQYDIAFSGSLDLEKMIPEGFLSVGKLVLPKGTAFSGDMYIQRGKKGFTCLVPEIFINTNAFSSVELVLSPVVSALDFTLSAYDKSGHISAEGSVSLGKNAFLQLYAAVDSINVANITATIVGIILPEEVKIRNNLEKALTPYSLTTEVYFSTDFTNLSFNSTRLVLAAAEEDGLYVLLSVKGNETGVDITDIAFARGGYTLSGNVHSDFDPSGEVSFTSAFTVNTIPYSISGLFSNSVLSLYGDYNLALSVFFDPLGDITGSFSADGLPLPAGPFLLSVTLDAGILLQENNGWKITLDRGSFQEMKGLFPLDTRVGFQGSMDSSGVFLNTITIADEVSQLSGYAGLNILPGSLNETRYALDVALDSPDSTESYKLSGRITVSDDMYFDAKASVNESPLMRFIEGQLPNNRASGTVTCSGTPSNIYASADISRVLYKTSGFDLDAHAKIILEDRLVSLSDAGSFWNGHNFSGLKGSFSLNTLQANLESKYNSILGKSGLSAEIGVVFDPEMEGSDSGFPDFATLLSRFNVKTTFSEIHWSTADPTEPLVLTFVREPGITALYAGADDALTGFLLDDGTFSLQSGKSVPVSFTADGNVINSMLSINVSGFHTDLDVLWPYTNVGVLQFDSGAIDGEFTISGLLRDPEFRGVLRASEIRVSAPGYIREIYGPVGFDIIAEGNTVSIPSFVTAGKDGSFATEAVLVFDRWLPSDVTVKTATLPGEVLKLDADNPLFKASGFASWKLAMDITPNGMILSGNAGIERGYFAVLSSGLARQSQTETTSVFDVRANLDLFIGKKVDFQFRWPTDDISVLRGLIQAAEPLRISLDTAVNNFSLKGAANLKGGEIFYIKRSFYLKQGTITFNENQANFDPLITLLAEIRERDVQGEPVRIILSVDNQPLSTFQPLLSSDPPKSDAELYALLGQAVTGDTTRETLIKDAVLTGTDLLTQIGLYRNAENKIRDFLGLDIFSIRTLVLQNAILGPAMQTTEDKPMTVGNYFDNTTVYIGKYWGSAIYFDGLSHFSYYDPLSAQNTANPQGVFGNMLIQLEIGAEVTTPFFLLRWSLSPTSNGFKNLFVSDNSVRLSWKFSY